jgi:UDP-GlcNAc:undecaprenyl-phosphate GlcNAc-1-phosphate transferase
MSLLTCFYTFMTALFSALVMVPFLRKWALEQGNVDAPDARKVHDTPMPRLGGVAIFLAFMLAVLTFAPMLPAVRGILIGGLIIFVTGLVDDLYELSARRKFAGEIAACLATIAIGELWLTNLGNLFGFGDIILPAWAGIPFTVFAVVGVVNAVNLIDGLDGLAGGVSTIALSAFLLLGVLDGDASTVLLGAALVGAVLGFLKYNFYPARIFMGDVGSLSVGFLLGFLAVHMTQHSGSTISPMVPFIILGLPILDTLRVMQRRLRKRLSPFLPDQNHVHHQFLNLGFAHRFTVLILYSMTLFWACFAVIFRNWPEYWLLFFFLVINIGGYQSLRYIKRHRERYTFLQRDSNTGLRNSALFLQTADRIDRLVPLLAVLVLLFVLLSIISFFSFSMISWQILAVFLVGSLVLLLRSENRAQEDFLLLAVYFVSFVVTYQMWHFTDLSLFGVSMKRYGDVLLIIVTGLVLLKVLFHRGNEFYLATPDYLALGLCLFFAIASGKTGLNLNLAGPLVRAMIVMIALRTILSQNPSHYRYIVWGSLGLLLIATGTGFLTA